ncbi:probable cytochrome P450 6a14 isoform X2 [Bacillus rossius redtenbacheri]
MAFVFVPLYVHAITWATASLLLLWLWTSHVYGYWTARGVPSPRPAPLFGNIRDIVLRREYTGKVFQRLYRALGDHGLGGVYLLFQPALLVRDPELVKTFLVKDFEHFHDRGFKVDERASPLSAHLISLAGPRWRRLRAELTPTFTSGKMRLMFGAVAECAGEMARRLAGVSGRAGGVDVKEVAAQFTTDVIGSCAFGLRVHSMDRPDCKFRKLGRKVFAPSLRMYLRIFTMMCLPSWMQFLLVVFKDRETESFFMDLVRDTVKYREENHVVRNDFLQLLIQLKNRKQVANGQSMNSVDAKETKNGYGVKNHQTPDFELTENLMAAQCFVFFMAGFETSSTTMGFCLHELAVNPDVQKRLRNEVDDALERHGGELSYEAVQSMSYMDLVVSETLRKYPPIPMLDRECTKAYTVPGTNVHLEEGIKVKIPVYAIHHDPKYYPEPDKFDPERFTEENRRKIPPFAYLPFGEGPRMCIGMRFGLMQAKVGLAALLSKFEFCKCPKTQIPLEMDAVTIVTSPKGGVWLKIIDRPKINQL